MLAGMYSLESQVERLEQRKLARLTVLGKRVNCVMSEVRKEMSGGALLSKQHRNYEI